MKPHLLTALTACALLPIAHAEDKPAVPATPTPKSNQAVVTIDVNGRKETKVINLDGSGGTTTLSINNEKSDGLGAVSRGTITVQTDKGGAQSSASAVASSGGGSSISLFGGGSDRGKPVAWLGISTDSLSDELAAQLPVAEGTGLIVRHIVPGSPAEVAGLQKNDILLKLEDQILTNPEQLRSLLRSRNEGDSAKLTYLRKGQQAEAVAKLVKKELSAADGVWPNLDLKHGMNALTDVLKNLNLDTAPLTIQKRIVVDPTGKITTEPFDGTVLDQVEEALKKSGITEEKVNEIQRRIEDAFKKSKVEPAEGH